MTAATAFDCRGRRLLQAANQKSSVPLVFAVKFPSTEGWPRHFVSDGVVAVAVAVVVYLFCHHAAIKACQHLLFAVAV
jgi:hypothetical protein